MNKLTDSDCEPPESIDQLFNKIRNFSDAMDLASEMNNLLNDVDKTRKRLKEKLMELEVLEMLAFTSDHPTVVGQRNQLFSVTRLCHSQEINEFINMQNDVEVEKGFSPYQIVMSYGETNKKRMTIKDRISYIYNNIQSRITRRNNTKKEYNELMKAGSTRGLIK